MLVGWACAQIGASGSAGNAVYFLKDDVHRQWCGYARESRFKVQVQPLRAMVVGKVDYTNGRVSAVHVTETDETGDWAVNDEYALDSSEEVKTLKRTINILPEDLSEEQLFVIENGKAVQQRNNHRDLRTGKPTQRSVSWFEPPPVITSLQAFPFSPLVVGKQQAVWSGGEFCISEGAK